MNSVESPPGKTKIKMFITGKHFALNFTTKHTSGVKIVDEKETRLNYKPSFLSTSQEFGCCNFFEWLNTSGPNVNM